MHQRQRHVALLLVAGLTLLLARTACADNWPRFRGPNGTGTSADSGIPVKWADQDVLWKTALPGGGNSSPVVWGERVFLQSATADGSQRLLICVSAHDGKVLWSASVPGSEARMHPKNSWASSTPAVDGERVYAVFWDGKNLSLVAYDFAGKSVWQHDLGSFTSQHGAGASPIVYEGKVIFANDQDGSSVLLALDAKTGKPAWEVPRKAFRACYSTPFILEQPDHVPQLIVASTAGISSYNPRTGAENWKWNWTFSGMALRTVASPLYHQGLIVVASGDGSGQRDMIAVKPGDKGDVTRTNLVWEDKRHRHTPYVPTILGAGDYLYWVNDQGFAGCQVARTGQDVWFERLTGPVTSSPVLINGKIYVVSDTGKVSVLAASPRFQVLATNSVGERVTATPAVADNRLFIRGESHLLCIGKPSGR